MANSGTTTTEASVQALALGKLPHFDGHGNIQKFIRTIDKRRDLEGWSEVRTAQIVRYLCSGIADAFIDADPELRNCSWAVLKAKLSDRFHPRTSRPAAFRELMELRQGQSSVVEYAGTVEATVAQHSDVLPELRDVDGRNELLIAIFNNGLASQIKKLLAATEHGEFGELVRAATRVEKILAESRREVHAVNTTEDHQSDGMHEHGASLAGNSNAYVTTATSHPPHVLAPPPWPYPPQPNLLPRPPVCYHYPQPGDLRRDCPSWLHSRDYAVSHPQYPQSSHYAFRPSSRQPPPPQQPPPPPSAQYGYPNHQYRSSEGGPEARCHPGYPSFLENKPLIYLICCAVGLLAIWCLNMVQSMCGTRGAY